MVALLGLALQPFLLSAQTFSVLHTFTADNAMNTNLDGGYPTGGLIRSGSILYGTASIGGTNNTGTIFSINTDGSDFTVIHTFAAGAEDVSPQFTNSEGRMPGGNLVLAGNTLYGTAASGGTNGTGTIFSMNTDGSGFTVLHAFATGNNVTNADGSGADSLVLSGNGTLYGTAAGGGANDYGTIFFIQTNGNNFTVLHTFDASDGGDPIGGLLLYSNVLYGTARGDGDHPDGIVYAQDTVSSRFTILHGFSPLDEGTNTDGAFPAGGVVLVNGTLYGTASTGGSNGNGTIFALNTNTLAFQTLYTFPASFTVTNLAGVNPEGTLVLAGNTLFGTANLGGTNNWGTLFSINTNGTAFSILHSFTRLVLATNVDGARPETGMILSGGQFFGTTHFGGNAYGNVFSLALAPGISSLALSGNNLMINGTNGVAGENCIVLASDDVSLPPSQWTPVTTNWICANGNFTITGTNDFSPAASRQFYTLKMQ